MKIALFIGEIAPHGKELMDFIHQDGFHCIKTQNSDEIDQVGRQIGKAILVFTDPKLAFRFLLENRWPDFPCKNILYLPKAPVVTPDSKKKLAHVNLQIYTSAEKVHLLEIMNKFLTSGSSEDTIGGELEFMVHQELGKKA